MVTAHLIHGFLGAGKTTFARQLERELPAIGFSQDEWMAHLYGNDPRPDEFPIFFRRISKQIARLWPRCLELGVDVILDLNFWCREERDETRETAATLGACTRLYRLTCPEDEAWRRIEKRDQSCRMRSVPLRMPNRSEPGQPVSKPCTVGRELTDAQVESREPGIGPQPALERCDGVDDCDGA